MAIAYSDLEGSGGIANTDMACNYAVLKKTINFEDNPLAINDILKLLNVPAGWVPVVFLFKVVTAATDTATMTVDIGVFTTGTTVGQQLKKALDMKTTGWSMAEPTMLPSASNQVIAVKAVVAIATGILDIAIPIVRVA